MQIPLASLRLYDNYDGTETLTTLCFPLKDLNLYDSFSGEEQLVGIHFSDDDLNASFLVDTFNVIEKRGSSGLKSGSISYHAAPPPTEAPSEDINDDGRVSIADAVMLSRYVGEDRSFICHHVSNVAVNRKYHRGK